MKMGAKLATGEAPVIAEGALDEGGRAGHDLCAEAEPAVVASHGSLDPGPGELQHPADIGGSDEVPGGTEDVRAKNLPEVNGAFDNGIRGPRSRAKRESPLGGSVLLSLHRSEPCDETRDASVPRPGDPLVSESQICYI